MQKEEEWGLGFGRDCANTTANCTARRERNAVRTTSDMQHGVGCSPRGVGCCDHRVYLFSPPPPKNANTKTKKPHDSSSAFRWCQLRIATGMQHNLDAENNSSSYKAARYPQQMKFSTSIVKKKKTANEPKGNGGVWQWSTRCCGDDVPQLRCEVSSSTQRQNTFGSHVRREKKEKG